MAKVKTKKEAETLVQLVVEALHEKKGNDVVSLDLRNIKDAVASFFVVAHGDSSTHVNALHQTVVELTRQAGQPHYRAEGTGNSEWIIVDFIDVVVHIFHRDKRDFYQLEELWHDAPATKHGTDELKAGRGKTVPFGKKTASAKPEIDTKEYKDKVTLAKTKQKAIRERSKEAKKSPAKGVKAPAKKPAAATKVPAKKAVKTGEKPAKKAVAKPTATVVKSAKKVPAKKTITKKAK